MEDLPSEMIAVQYNKYYENSFSEVMEVNKLPIPSISSKQVLLKVHATSVNPVDWKLARGFVSPSLSFPVIPCFDVAGVIVGVGSACERLKEGDEVYGVAKVLNGRLHGGAAQYANIPEKCLSLKPRSISFSEAASLPLIGLTAYQSLHGRLHESSRILILGGSGGPGSFAIQMAKASGSYVASTCSPRNKDLLESMGVDKIVNYKLENWWEAFEGQNFDVIYDCVGDKPGFNEAHRVLAENGVYIEVASDDEEPPSLGKKFEKGLSFMGRKVTRMFGSGPDFDHIEHDPSKAHKQLPEITHMIEEHLIRPIMEKVYPLDQISEAMDYCASHKVRGKVCVQVIDEDTSEFLMRPEKIEEAEYVEPEKGNIEKVKDSFGKLKEKTDPYVEKAKKKVKGVIQPEKTREEEIQQPETARKGEIQQPEKPKEQVIQPEKPKEEEIQQPERAKEEVIQPEKAKEFEIQQETPESKPVQTE